MKHAKQGTLVPIASRLILRRIVLQTLKQYSLYNSFSYKIKFGWKESIKRPVTFSQKIYYLRNAYKNVPLATLVSDKIKVREYVQEKVGGGLLNNLLGVYDDPSDIDYTNLPDRFVIKTNHAAGTNIIVKDKNSLDIEVINKQLSKWLKMNYSDSLGEMQYYNIKPQILIEVFLENYGYDNPIDYKFWCFDGKVEFVQVFERSNQKFIRYSFNLFFKNTSMINPYYEGENYSKFQQPDSFYNMIKYASALSKRLPFARVDFYDIYGQCIFGEITLTPAAGNNHYLMDDAQISLGKKINLSILDNIRSGY